MILLQRHNDLAGLHKTQTFNIKVDDIEAYHKFMSQKLNAKQLVINLNKIKQHERDKFFDIQTLDETDLTQNDNVEGSEVIDLYQDEFIRIM